MIQINDLHKKYGKNKVLKGINLEIKEGVSAILGPNASGKTTLNKCILGMVFPEQGSIQINELNISNHHLYRKDINYLPQIANFPNNLTVYEVIRMIKDLRNLNDLNESHLLELLGLYPFWDEKLNSLSGGTKQKVNLLLTFLFDHPILILDEPTAGLDPATIITLKKLILSEKEKGKTIIITSHILSFVEQMADEIIFILEGRIYYKGTIDNLKTITKQDNLEQAVAVLTTETNV